MFLRRDVRQQVDYFANISTLPRCAAASRHDTHLMQMNTARSFTAMRGECRLLVKRKWKGLLADSYDARQIPSLSVFSRLSPRYGTSRPRCVEGHRMRPIIAGASVIAVLIALDSNAANPLPTPGLYQVEVRISLPNVQDVAEPIVLNRCVRPSDLESGQAFSIMSDNPLKRCDLLDYQLTADTAVYRIACPGPNKGSAVAVFETTRTTYRGTIKMNMGGKNMTMSETQVGKRIADCE